MNAEQNKIQYMKVHADYGRYHRKYPHCPTHVPMELLNEEQAQTNHGQSLARLNERGGMCPIELVCNIEKRRLSLNMTSEDEECIQSLIKYINKFNSK